MKRKAIPFLMAAIMAGCAAPQQGGPSPEHGFNTFGQGIGHLILSPFMIAAGLLEGISTLPYFVSTDLHELNRAMVEANAQVDLERTYAYAYAEEIGNVPGSGETGRVFRRLSEATEHFQRVLEGYGVEDYDRYILTGVRTADRQGYTLYAVAYRPQSVVTVREGGVTRTLEPRDFDYYKPILRDASGRPMDVIIDWAGVPRTAIRTQKGQAILMTIAANSVLINRRSDDYWAVERRWVGGEFQEIVAERKRYLDQRMGVDA
jgi:hypothetical protein